MDVKEILRARDTFFTAAQPTVPAHVAAAVRPEILASWRRTRQHGLIPAKALPQQGPAPGSAGQLVRAASAVLKSRMDVLAGTSAAITLTDREGVLLHLWVVNHGFADQLNELGLRPGCDITEAAVGTTSTAIALEAGQEVLVTGPEHVAERAIRMTTASALVRQPATKKLLGVIGLVCDYVDTTPLTLSWVREIASAIEREVLAVSSQRQRFLLTDYLQASADARHPVLCLDDNTVIGNAAAVRLLSSLNQAVLWEMAAEANRTADRVERALESLSGQRIKVDVRPILRAGRPTSSEIRLSVLDQPPKVARPAPARPRRKPATTAPVGPAGLVGRAPAWLEVCEKFATAWDARSWIVLSGAPGTGKTALVEATAAAKGVPLHRCTGLDSLDAAVRTGAPAVLLEGMDDLAQEDRSRAARLLEALPGSTPIAMITAHEVSPSSRLVVTTRPTLVLRVPSLRERPEDVPLLLDALTSAASSADRCPRWLPETVQTLTRVRWRSNISSLRALVTETLESLQGPYVRVSDLPPELIVQAARRTLSPLEEAEALIVLRAMRDADGNKKLAASGLGVARSTLYRKIRSLGLDLSVANY